MALLRCARCGFEFTYVRLGGRGEAKIGIEISEVCPVVSEQLKERGSMSLAEMECPETMRAIEAHDRISRP